MNFEQVWKLLKVKDRTLHPTSFSTYVTPAIRILDGEWERDPTKMGELVCEWLNTDYKRMQDFPVQGRDLSTFQELFDVKITAGEVDGKKALIVDIMIWKSSSGLSVDRPYRHCTCVYPLFYLPKGLGEMMHHELRREARALYERDERLKEEKAVAQHYSQLVKEGAPELVND